MGDLVWNELSIITFTDHGGAQCALNPIEARTQMTGLVELMRLWAQAGQPRVIRIPSAIVTLAPQYTLDQWRNDRLVSRDERQLFRLYASRRPELDGVLDDVRDRATVSEMLCEGRTAQGLLAAWLLDGVAVSWNTHSLWREPKVFCTLHEVRDVDGFIQRSVEVPHASHPVHLSTWLSNRASERYRYLSDGPSLLANATHWLPALCFVGPALDQLPEWGPNREGWPFVVRALCQLQDLCTSWGEHPFPHERISSPCSPEGTRVDTNADLRAAREFVCEDGKRRYFTWHVKHYKLNLRIYYDADDRLRVLRIAYIGTHLPL